jgi:hypothetical protein
MNLAGRLPCWNLQLQDLDLKIVNRSGKLHHDADALSRQPIDPSEKDITTRQGQPTNTYPFTRQFLIKISPKLNISRIGII